MDPQAVWDGMLIPYADGDIESARQFAISLRYWLANDGFPPTTLGTPGIPTALERELALAGLRFLLRVPNSLLDNSGEAPEEQP